MTALRSYHGEKGKMLTAWSGDPTQEYLEELTC